MTTTLHIWQQSEQLFWDGQTYTYIHAHTGAQKQGHGSSYLTLLPCALWLLLISRLPDTPIPTRDMSVTMYTGVFNIQLSLRFDSSSQCLEKDPNCYTVLN